MSASQYQRNADMEAAAKKRRTRLISALVFIIAVVVIVGSFVVNSNYFYTGTAAVTIGDTDYTAAELNYLYYNLAGNAGFSDTSSLDEQYYDENTTYEEYFRQQAEEYLVNLTVMVSAAEAEGMTLSEESTAYVEKELTTADAYAAVYSNGNTDSYLMNFYGKGFDRETFQRMLEMQALADQYSAQKLESFEYTEEELKAYYDEHKDEFDMFEYYVYFVENGDDAEAAYALADEIALAETAEEFAQNVYDSASEEDKPNYEDPESTRYISSGTALDSYDYGAWLKESGRSEVDTTVIESSSGGGYYVLMFIDRDSNNYESVAMRHILAQVTADENGEYTTEAINTARAEIDEVVAEYESGDMTEDSFAALAEEYSDDTGSNTNGGLYEHIYHNQMVQPINDYIFDSAREPGDTEVLYYEGPNYAGYHFVYFVGTDGLYCDYIAETAMSTEDFNDWMAAETAKYPVTEHYSIRFVG